MITETEYKEYFGVNATPSNFDRLVYLSIQELRSIIVKNVPTSDDLVYSEFQKAIMEQINYFDINGDLLTESKSKGARLGSYQEGSSENNDSNSKSINRISPMAYDILLNAGLLYPGLGGC